jgi:hypothetical protein
MLKALDMIHGIRSAFGELLELAEWMDDPTRKVAKEKVVNSYIIIVTYW